MSTYLRRMCLGLLTAFPLFLSADSQEQMLSNLDTIKNAFKVSYAPAEWKNKFSGWDLDPEIDKAKANVLASPGMSTKDFQIILKNFLNTTKDYHVSVVYYSTEEASLPFRIKGANGKYFISFINYNKLSPQSFPFSIGDELVQFDSRPVEDVINELMEVGTHSNEQTDRALAELNLTKRSGKSGHIVPKGPITVTIWPAGSKKAYSHQLIWDYTEEKVAPLAKPKIIPTMTALSKSMRKPSAKKKKIFKDPIFQKLMLLPLYSDLKVEPRDWDEEDFEDGNENEEQPEFDFIGNRNSFIPELGRIWWESSKTCSFKAYLFELSDHRLIGYVRIPTYMPTSGKAVEEFAKIIQLFEERSEALVIDQVDNPGGSLFYLYALASMLTDQPLVTPRHRSALTYIDVVRANLIAPIFEHISSDADARAILGKTFGGLPVTYQLSQFMLNYFRFINNEWNAGRQLTDPYYLYGIDHINPSTSVQYTKPILLLINSLCFSGGDFFPAILQDNQRVVLMGSRTAGAGGFITSVNFPNLNGIAEIHLTASIAERADKNPIENLGVTPDIPYEITENDLRNNYQDYAEAIRSVLEKLIEVKSE